MEVQWGGGSADWVLPLPPYGPAPGPLVDDGEVLGAYASGVPAGHSNRLHVEGPSLMADGDVAAGLRLGPGVVLVRVDLPDDLLDVRPSLEAALAAEDLVLVDEKSLLAGIVALQALGLRLSTWDLWGTAIEAAFADLRRWAVGNQDLPPC